MIAGIGGWFLAGRSLSPVVALPCPAGRAIGEASGDDSRIRCHGLRLEVGSSQRWRYRRMHTEFSILQANWQGLGEIFPLRRKSPHPPFSSWTMTR